jgi:hypothetical protein
MFMYYYNYADVDDFGVVSTTEDPPVQWLPG